MRRLRRFRGLRVDYIWGVVWASMGYAIFQRFSRVAHGTHFYERRCGHETARLVVLNWFFTLRSWNRSPMP